MTRAAIYARISLDREGEGLGVLRQQKDCRRLCQDQGWEIAGVYVDNNISATAKGVVRPEYARLLVDIAEKQVDAVVVYDLDRLTRRPIELEGFVNICASAGVTQLVFVGGGIDMGTGDGLLIARIKGAFAAEEARKISERGKRKKLELAERGLPTFGGYRPFGFNIDRMGHNEVEANLIRSASKRVIKGDTLAKIARDWNARGVRSTTGKDISIQSLKRSLTVPRTTGLREHQGEVLGEAAWKAIVDRKTWEKVCSILNDPSRRQRPHLDYPLRGIIRCGECGHLLGGDRHRYRSYRCNAKAGGCGRVWVTGAGVEDFVVSQAFAVANSSHIRHIIDSEAGCDEELTKRLTKQNTDDTSALFDLDDDYESHLIRRATWVRRKEKITVRIDERTKVLAKVRGRTALRHLGESLSENRPTMSSDDRWQITKLLVTSVYVFRSTGTASNHMNPNRVVVHWRYGGALPTRSADSAC